MADLDIQNRELLPISKALDVLKRFPGSIVSPEDRPTVPQQDRAMHDLIAHFEREETSAEDRRKILEELERHAFIENIRPGVRRHLAEVPALWEGNIRLFISQHDEKRARAKRRSDLRDRDRLDARLAAQGMKVHRLREE